MARYDLIAIDLDGTLLDHRGRVSEANRAAVARARDAGVTVTLCTGRGLAECQFAVEAVEQRDPVVVAGGSIIACPVVRRTLHRFALDQPVTARATEFLLDHGHAVLILKDALEVGYDYLVIHGEPHRALDPVTAWWFQEHGIPVRYARHLHEDEHPEHTVRLGVCGRASQLARAKADIQAAFGEKVLVQHFPAVIAPEHARTIGEDRYDIFEVFDARANKWSALKHVAEQRGIAPERIAAIGDEVNDVQMIASAGLGIAMENAVPEVRRAARRHTLSNREDGVAYAIDRILADEW